MHEILFHGKRPDNGEWVEGLLARYNPKFEVANIVNNFEILVPVKTETVGQCTGLKDKNGRRIFEGDICRNTKTGEVVSVKWHGTFAGFVWSKQKEKSHLSDFGELFRVYDKYEVIGNIHDNPELLEGGNT